MSVIRLSLKRGVNTLSANCLLQNQQKFVVTIMAPKHLSTIPVSKNLTLLTNDKAKSLSDVKQDKPLCIMHAWLLAQPKHIRKYADIYLKKDFDVLTVTVSPWQLLWPLTGSQVVAGDVLNFINNNFINSPLFLHGFSVGGYVWSETLVKIASEQEKYKPLTSRFVAQVWDSAADINDIPDGVPMALFPKNPVMEKAMRKYINYHLRTFDKVATTHYIRGSQMFHTNLIRTPCLFMVSQRDPIGKLSSNQSVRENWQAQGMDVYWKDWVDSPHVGHLIKYRAAYTDLLNEFLDKLKNDPFKEVALYACSATVGLIRHAIVSSINTAIESNTRIILMQMLELHSVSKTIAYIRDTEELLEKVAILLTNEVEVWDYLQH